MGGGQAADGSGRAFSRRFFKADPGGGAQPVRRAGRQRAAAAAAEAAKRDAAEAAAEQAAHTARRATLLEAPLVLAPDVAMVDGRGLEAARAEAGLPRGHGAGGDDDEKDDSDEPGAASGPGGAAPAGVAVGRALLGSRRGALVLPLSSCEAAALLLACTGAAEQPEAETAEGAEPPADGLSGPAGACLLRCGGHGDIAFLLALVADAMLPAAARFVRHRALLAAAPASDSMDVAVPPALDDSSLARASPHPAVHERGPGELGSKLAALADALGLDLAASAARSGGSVATMADAAVRGRGLAGPDATASRRGRALALTWSAPGGGGEPFAPLKAACVPVLPGGAPAVSKWIGRAREEEAAARGRAQAVSLDGDAWADVGALLVAAALRSDGGGPLGSIPRAVVTGLVAPVSATRAGGSAVSLGTALRLRSLCLVLRRDGPELFASLGLLGPAAPLRDAASEFPRFRPPPPAKGAASSSSSGSKSAAAAAGGGDSGGVVLLSVSPSTAQAAASAAASSRAVRAMYDRQGRGVAARLEGSQELAYRRQAHAARLGALAAAKTTSAAEAGGGGGDGPHAAEAAAAVTPAATRSSITAGLVKPVIGVAPHAVGGSATPKKRKASASAGKTKKPSAGASGPAWRPPSYGLVKPQTDSMGRYVAPSDSWEGSGLVDSAAVVLASIGAGSAPAAELRRKRLAAGQATAKRSRNRTHNAALGRWRTECKGVEAERELVEEERALITRRFKNNPEAMPPLPAMPELPLRPDRPPTPPADASSGRGAAFAALEPDAGRTHLLPATPQAPARPYPATDADLAKAASAVSSGPAARESVRLVALRLPPGVKGVDPAMFSGDGAGASGGGKGKKGGAKRKGPAGTGAGMVPASMPYNVSFTTGRGGAPAFSPVRPGRSGPASGPSPRAAGSAGLRPSAGPGSPGPADVETVLAAALLAARAVVEEAAVRSALSAPHSSSSSRGYAKSRGSRAGRSAAGSTDAGRSVRSGASRGPKAPASWAPVTGAPASREDTNRAAAELVRRVVLPALSEVPVPGLTDALVVSVEQGRPRRHSGGNDGPAWLRDAHLPSLPGAGVAEAPDDALEGGRAGAGSEGAAGWRPASGASSRPAEYGAVGPPGLIPDPASFWSPPTVSGAETPAASVGAALLVLERAIPGSSDRILTAVEDAEARLGEGSAAGAAERASAALRAVCRAAVVAATPSTSGDHSRSIDSLAAAAGVEDGQAEEPEGMAGGGWGSDIAPVSSLVATLALPSEPDPSRRGGSSAGAAAAGEEAAAGRRSLLMAAADAGEAGALSRLLLASRSSADWAPGACDLMARLLLLQAAALGAGGRFAEGLEAALLARAVVTALGPAARRHPADPRLAWPAGPGKRSSTGGVRSWSGEAAPGAASGVASLGERALACAAFALAGLGRHAPAAHAFAHLASRRAAAGGEPAASAWLNLGVCLARAGRVAEGEEALTRAEGAARSDLGTGHPLFDAVVSAKAAALQHSVSSSAAVLRVLDSKPRTLAARPDKGFLLTDGAFTLVARKPVPKSSKGAAKRKAAKR